MLVLQAGVGETVASWKTPNAAASATTPAGCPTSAPAARSAAPQPEQASDPGGQPLAPPGAGRPRPRRPRPGPATAPRRCGTPVFRPATACTRRAHPTRRPRPPPEQRPRPFRPSGLGHTGGRRRPAQLVGPSPVAAAAACFPGTRSRQRGEQAAGTLAAPTAGYPPAARVGPARIAAGPEHPGLFARPIVPRTACRTEPLSSLNTSASSAPDSTPFRPPEQKTARNAQYAGARTQSANRPRTTAARGPAAGARRRRPTRRTAPPARGWSPTR